MPGRMLRGVESRQKWRQIVSLSRRQSPLQPSVPPGGSAPKGNAKRCGSRPPGGARGWKRRLVGAHRRPL